MKRPPTVSSLLLLLFFWLQRADGFMGPATARAARRRNRVSVVIDRVVASPPSRTALGYKVLGAPVPGSDKPTVLEEGNNKIVSGNLDGSFRRRMEEKHNDNGVERQLLEAASSQMQEKNGNDSNNSRNYVTPYDNSQYAMTPEQQPSSPAPSQPMLHVEPLRHWGGQLEVTVTTPPSAASSVLVDFLSDPESGIAWTDRGVVELGAGEAGTCGIAAALSGAAVVVTDGAPSPELLETLQRNVATYEAHYAHEVRVASLIWGDVAQLERVCQGRYPDFVLMADLVDGTADLANLRITLETVCGPETWVVVAHEWRTDTDAQLLQGLFQAFEGPYEMDASGAPTDRPVSVYLYRRR